MLFLDYLNYHNCQAKQDLYNIIISNMKYVFDSSFFSQVTFHKETYMDTKKGDAQASP